MTAAIPVQSARKMAVSVLIMNGQCWMVKGYHHSSYSATNELFVSIGWIWKRKRASEKKSEKAECEFLKDSVTLSKLEKLRTVTLIELHRDKWVHRREKRT